MTPTPTLSLTGALVRLVTLGPAHLDGPYVSWLNDPDVCRYNSHGEVEYTRALAEAYLEHVAASGDIVLAVLHAGDDRHVGNVSLQAIDRRARSAEFAILMGDPSVAGTGCATEAARLLLAHGFEALGLHRVYAGTVAENDAMRRLALRLGMREEGVQRQATWKHGTFHDVVLYGVLAEEWAATRG